MSVDGKNLYVVDCNLCFEMVVAASDKEEAREVALENWLEDISNGGLEPITHARFVTSKDKRWIETAYAGLDGMPFSNDSSQLTFEDYFAVMESNNG